MMRSSLKLTTLPPLRCMRCLSHLPWFPWDIRVTFSPNPLNPSTPRLLRASVQITVLPLPPTPHAYKMTTPSPLRPRLSVSLLILWHRTSVHKGPLLSLSRFRVLPRVTVLQTRLCRLLRLWRVHLHKRARLPSSRRTIFRRGHGGDKPPLPVPLSQPLKRLLGSHAIEGPSASRCYTSPLTSTDSLTPKREARSSRRPDRLGPHSTTYLPPSPRPSPPHNYWECKAQPWPLRLPFPNKLTPRESILAHLSSATLLLIEAQEQRAEPACDAAIRYLLLGSPSFLPDDLLLHFPSHKTAVHVGNPLSNRQRMPSPRR